MKKSKSLFWEVFFGGLVNDLRRYLRSFLVALLSTGFFVGMSFFVEWMGKNNVMNTPEVPWYYVFIFLVFMYILGNVVRNEEFRIEKEKRLSFDA